MLIAGTVGWRAVGSHDCTASVHLWLYMCCVEVRGIWREVELIVRDLR